MNILVTGGAGFIGSHFIKIMSEQTEHIICLDKLTYAGDLRRLTDVSDNPKYTFIHGDICNIELLNDIFDKHSIDIVINFAAETHVDRSIDGPMVFIKTNITGTGVLLETARRHWSVCSDDRYCNEYKEGTRFIQISTDEVYGALGETGIFAEESPIAPNSPYSASKAAADMLVRSYYQTYGFPAIITRCSNNYGPWQTPEKLIPLMIKNAVADKKLPVYGDGLNVRDWIHVEDHCEGIASVLKSGIVGEVYNIGGGGEMTNIDIVKSILRELGKSDDLIEYIKDRPGHDRRYAIDSSKITNSLGWKAKRDFNEGLKKTIAWYVKNKKWAEEYII